MGTILQDIRYGLRMLRTSPGFTVVAIVTLALGIGTNVAIFSFVDELWLRPMPVPHADQLVRIFTSNPSSEGEIERGWNSYPDFADLRTSAKTLAGVALLERRGAFYDDGVQNSLVTAAVLSDNFFDVLQPVPAVGRRFTENELKSPQALPVMLSYPFWRRQFGGDLSLVGRTIIVDRRQVAVVGILPRGFRGTEAMQVPDLWIPMTTWGQFVPGEQQRLVSRSFRDYELFGRLQPGVTLQQAGVELAAVANALAQSFPSTNSGRKMTAVPEGQTRGDWTAMVGLVLLGIAALVLLIACANVAGLLLARAEHRRKEIATRVALGATAGQIVRQLLTETMLLTVLGTVAALVFGNLVLQLLPALMPPTTVPSGVDAYLSLRGFWFAMVVAVVSLFLFGLVPALQASHLAPALALKQFGATGAAPRRPFRSVLVVAQVALSVVMVVSAGLLVRSVLNALNANPGFNAHQNMLVLELSPSFGTRTAQESLAYVREIRRRLEALPQVTATSIAMRFPFGMSGGGATRKVFLPGDFGSNDREGVTINFDPVGDGFFSVLGTRILRGRTIEAHDLQTSAHVTVVNQQMASRFWPNGDAVGKRFRLDKADGDEYQVVGVAEDSKYNDYQEAPIPLLYLPMGSDDYGELALAVGTRNDPGALAATVRRILREVNRNIPVLGILTWRDQIREALYEERMTARLIVALGGLGLLLAAAGIYGLMAFLVARRTQEIGIRVALGAPRNAILRLVVRHAFGLTAVGLAAGILGSVAATRALRSFLFGVAPTDVLVFAGAIAVLLVVTLAATLVPAMRAIRVDPMVALHYE
ncbi:MAG: ABC transporter permease [Acidobacteriia bacterium]|nr:ABC transporter permease [Terriglobia bacterium]